MRRYGVMVLMVVVVLLSGSVRTQASSKVPSLEYSGGVPSSCAPTGILNIPDYVNINGSGSFTVAATVPGHGVIGSFSGNFITTLNQPATFGLILSPTQFTFPDHTLITVFFTTYTGPNQTGDLSFLSTGTWDCTNGATVNPGANYVVPPVITATIGNGFVLKTINCNTPVYDRPGGQAVGNNRILLGQTWFVNPYAVKDSRGNAWTEIYVSGQPNSYIPTSCVQ